MRILVLLAVVSLSACSWFGHHKAPPPPKPTEILVTGAPLGSLVFIDGVQAGTPATRNDHSQVLDVAPGTHIVEVHLGDTVVYHEDTYVAAGQRRSVIVLSGSTR